MSLSQRLQNSSHDQQSGVALITILMIFAIVTIMTADTTARMGLDIRKTSFYLQNAQANEYALSAEAIARELLFSDFEEDQKGSNNDHLAEKWNDVQLPLEMSDADIEIVIRDLQGRYNINNLIAEDGKSNPEALNNFRRLLAQQDIESRIADNISDWIDSDQIPTGYYSEDSSYLNKKVAYRAANQAIYDISELMAISDIDIKTFNTLAPLISALPSSSAKININTAPEAVLATISEKLEAEQIVAARTLLEQGFDNNQQFLESEITAGKEINSELISVSSEYFEIWIKATFQDQTSYLRSIIYRDAIDGRLALLGRTFLRPIDGSQNNPFLSDVDSSQDNEPESP